ncbi:MAG: nucleotide pyrophosphohydrolase [Pseudomonadota bacterium]|nr:nucleotide pyrophosphohydrolase [Pseudomonadota bacterium]
MSSASLTPLRDLVEVRDRLREFADARDWDQFHSPKNLAMALIAEVAEVVEHFQWLTEAESACLPPERKAEVAEELADVLAYLVRIADKLDVDLLAAVTAKIERNEERYPADRARGSARKYNEL